MRLLQQVGDHRGRRCLAMRTGHTQSPATVGNLTQYTGTLHHLETIPPEIAELRMVFWDGRGIDDQRLCRIGKVVGDQVHIVFIMNDGSFIVQLFRQTGRGLVVTGHLLSLRKEIAYQGTHPDPAGSNKIDSRYIVYIHIFLFVTILYYKDTIFLSYLL